MGEFKIVFGDIKFKANEATLLPESYEPLKKAAKTMKDFPAFKITIEGHSASVGKPDFEKELSMERATTVKNYLVQDLGIDAGRLSTAGLGSSKPISTDKAMNRRIDFVVKY
jgi:outer membrane protein OmpA-like peptidoglycan-associated protein